MSYNRDFAERVIRTFIAAALAVAAAGVSGVVDWDSGKALLLSAMAAGMTAAMSLLAKMVGDPGTASFWSAAPGEHGAHEVPADLLQLHEALEAAEDDNQ